MKKGLRPFVGDVSTTLYGGAEDLMKKGLRPRVAWPSRRMRYGGAEDLMKKGLRRLKPTTHTSVSGAGQKT